MFTEGFTSGELIGLIEFHVHWRLDRVKLKEAIKYPLFDSVNVETRKR